MIEQVHHNLENMLQEIGLNENKLKMCNSPSVGKIKPLSVRPNFMSQRVHMNVVQLETMRSRKFKPSS